MLLLKILFGRSTQIAVRAPFGSNPPTHNTVLLAIYERDSLAMFASDHAPFGSIFRNTFGSMFIVISQGCVGVYTVPQEQKDG